MPSHVTTQVNAMELVVAVVVEGGMSVRTVEYVKGG